jgi:methyl-accepting chemotaxis protein
VLRTLAVLYELLAAAVDAIRGEPGTAAAVAQREREFTAVLAAHGAELQNSPGRAWMALIREDFVLATQLRLQVARYDAVSRSEWHGLLEESAALTAGVDDLLQKPARRELLLAAQRTASSAESAEDTLVNTGALVLALLLFVSLLLFRGISLPVRRLTAATRLLAGGDRAARAPRGGSAEVDELAESFNTMADRIETEEAKLQAHEEIGQANT